MELRVQERQRNRKQSRRGIIVLEKCENKIWNQNTYESMNTIAYYVFMHITAAYDGTPTYKRVLFPSASILAPFGYKLLGVSGHLPISHRADSRESIFSHYFRSVGIICLVMVCQVIPLYYAAGINREKRLTSHITSAVSHSHFNLLLTLTPPSGGRVVCTTIWITSNANHSITGTIL